MTATAPILRRLPLRFSLRVLLLAVTAFAIGFPIWYRWPYEEAEFLRGTAGTGPVEMRRVKTWQRQWGGGPLQHGEERFYVGNMLTEVQTFQNGKLHGPFRRLNHPENYLYKDGQYEGGVKEGAWRWLDPQGKELARAEYRAGKLVRAVTPGHDGKPQVIEFREDEGVPRIVVGGRTLDDRLARLAAAGRIDDVRLRESLAMPIDFKCGPMRLEPAVLMMADNVEVLLILDPHHADADRKVSGTFHDIPFSMALTVLAGAHDLACDYRYGHVWVTSAEDAKNWHDPTGVAGLVPPQNSQLAKSWNEPVNVQANERPLAEVLDWTAGNLAIAIDTSRIAPGSAGEISYPVTRSFYGMKFQHVLGIWLYETRCRCKLEGETLVILPPE